MVNDKNRAEDLIRSFREREKELECLYKIEDVLKQQESSLEDIVSRIIAIIPSGLQYPDICQVQITIGTDVYKSPDFNIAPWVLRTDIVVQNREAGEISVYYMKEMPESDEGPFLKQEKRLLQTIAGRLGSFILQRQMKATIQDDITGRLDIAKNGVGEWQVVLDLLRRTDKNLYTVILQRMLNHMCWSGLSEAEELRNAATTGEVSTRNGRPLGDNQPRQRVDLDVTESLGDDIFRIASKHYTDEQILAYLQKWIQNDRLSFLTQVSNRNLTLAELVDAIRRYRDMAPEGIDLSSVTKKGVEVSLIRRFFSTQLDYINIAKKYIEVSDYYDLLDRTIFTSESHGRLGGKCAGLFLAKKIIKRSKDSNDLLREVKVPKSWYITSDVLLTFLRYNNLDEVVEQKYKDINQVRIEYPHVIQSFKNGRFPPEVVQGLSMVLDEFEGKPLIIRSSSLLEDSLGAAFSGKYKSLFLANQGGKQERLEALMDAIAEVYASTFGPDPIEYRAERGLLDFSEEMGIMIQEVIGKRVGIYFLPALSGVAFSRNEFRWSPRIKREDGLVRLVPGLGTRAVDRVSDDYPILIAPAQPGLRANVTVDEIVYYSPRYVDVINLETNMFETVKVKDLLKMCGDEYQLIEQIVSVYDGQHLRKPIGIQIDFANDDLVVTFDGLIGETPFIHQVHGMLDLLEHKLGTPVDIEFAHDGEDFYLLQCRPQSYSGDSAPAPIPKDIPKEKILFTANRYISNGKVPDITHIVYVDPQKYGELSERSELVAVGRAVGKLNKLLPKRQFILMGPGRWGSRGDIKLGVSVSYSDISNTAALIEIARKKGNYMPDLSFGTHFFQDLVEGQIRYVPLYPDDEGIVFNETFLLGAPNLLSDVLPDFASLTDVVRLIDLPRATGGLILRLLMNAELNEAMGILDRPGSEVAVPAARLAERETRADNSWVWRLRMAEHIASQLDPERFGVEGFYVFGSTKNATAGLKSDIDILIHFRGSEKMRNELMAWLEGWSLCLDEMNYLRSGYRIGGLLDVHIVTDDDIACKTSYAVKIGAVTDPARSLPTKKRD
jgi:pyruvate,water dikinase